MAIATFDLSVMLGIAAVHVALVGLGLIVAPRAFGAGAVPRRTEPSTARSAIILCSPVRFAIPATLDVWGSLDGSDR